MTPEDIIRGCKQGKEESYRLLVDTYASTLMGICMRYLSDRPRAQDALQETYILVFRSIHRFEETGTLKAWLSKIAVNCCLKELRKNKSLRFAPEDLSLEQIPEMPGIYEQLEAEDLLRLLDMLPAHYRIIFNLHVIEGYSHKEISDMCGIQESLSRTKLTRARKILQEHFTTQIKKSIV